MAGAIGAGALLLFLLILVGATFSNAESAHNGGAGTAPVETVHN